jgi:hypothetical protein
MADNEGTADETPSANLYFIKEARGTISRKYDDANRPNDN